MQISSALIVLVAMPAAAWPDDKPSAFTVGGLLFGDLYHIPSHHLAEGDGATGAMVRRRYLTFNVRSGNGWFGRLRFEVNQSDEFETCEFDADVKDLYVGYKTQHHEFLLGLQPTRTFDVIGSVWDLRYLMRTPTDLQGEPSRDSGISAKGNFNDTWRYRVRLGSGLDYGDETGDGDKAMAAVNWKVSDHWLLVFYLDYEERPGPTDIATAQIFAAYQAEGIRAGAQYFYRDRGIETRGELASAFVVKDAGPRSSVIGRIDRITEPSIKGDNISYIPFDPRSAATKLLTGFELRVSDHFRITPNTILISYDRNEDGIQPATDFFLRVAAYIEFEQRSRPSPGAPSSHEGHRGISSLTPACTLTSERLLFPAISTGRCNTFSKFLCR